MTDNNIWTKWVNDISDKLIKEDQIKVGDRVKYDSATDPNKAEKIKLLHEIHNLEQHGYKTQRPVAMNSSLEEIKNALELLKHRQRAAQEEQAMQMITGLITQINSRLSGGSN